MSSQLETFLKEQQAEGILDSQGKFTLDRGKALEKLAAFQLPRETSWILKVVQAAVRCGAPGLEIRQTSTDTEVRFCAPETWTLAALEADLVDPETSADPALDHLKRGLWSVGINGLRPFHCSLPGSAQALVWNGNSFHQTACQISPDFQLTVSHRTIFEGKGLPLLRSIEAATCNAEIAKELRSSAFTCPIPLTLDSCRLDALQLCPEHGFGASSYPIFLGLTSGDLPELHLPPGTFGGYELPVEGHDHLKRLLTTAQQPQQLAVAAMLSIHVERTTENRKQIWRRPAQEHHFFWIRDGVVVTRCTLADLPPCPVSAAIFADASGLATDLSGLAVVDDTERRRLAYRLLWPQVQAAQLDLKSFIKSNTKSEKLGGGLIMGLGGWLLLSHPLMALGTFGFGLFLLKYSGSEAAELEVALQKDLESLKSQWHRHLVTP